MGRDSHLEPKVVFAGNAWEAGMVVSLLEDEEIQAYKKDEFMGSLVSLWEIPGGAGAIKVVVAREDYSRAKQIVEKFEKNRRNQ